jgi:DNA-binding MarR family transcriptional regulator
MSGRARKTGPGPASDPAREAWLLMSGLVLDEGRRRRVADALGMSFGRIRAIRRIARQPMSMGELASALGIDRPNATVLVDDLEARGLVRRRPHPTDRRAKIVEATAKGAKQARRAEEILSTPPSALSDLPAADLEALHRILSGATGDDEGQDKPRERP